MTFANQKEETLNLELTSYGRYLLSLGKFKPAQYAFFDEDIIYDRQYVGSGSISASAELQNNIEGRIQEETPRLKPQTIYRGAQIGVFSENPSHVNNLMPGVVAASDKQSSDFLLETPDSSYIFSDPIGNSAYNSNNVAAWDVGFYMAGLASVDYAWTGSVNASHTGSTTVPTTFIPQLKCNINTEAHFYPKPAGNIDIDEYIYETSLGPKNLTAFGDMEGIDGFNYIHTLSDDSSVVFIKDYAFLKIEEANTEFEKENFEVEVYMVKSEATDKNPEVLERLYFSKDGDINDKHVEYYFEVDFDFDIDNDEFCVLSRRKEKIRSLYADKIFNCNKKGPDGSEVGFNVYATAENQEEDVCD